MGSTRQCSLRFVAPLFARGDTRVELYRSDNTGQLLAVKVFNVEACRRREVGVYGPGGGVLRNGIFALNRELSILSKVQGRGTALPYGPLTVKVWAGEVRLTSPYYGPPLQCLCASTFAPLYQPGPAYLNILRQLLEGVEYLHSMGIVHKDLSPVNICLSHYPSTVFSPCHHPVAVSSRRSRARTSAPRLTIIDYSLSEEGMEVYDSHGSPYFSPPEVFDRPPCAGGARDIWSVGAVALCMLQGWLGWWVGTGLDYEMRLLSMGEVQVPEGAHAPLLRSMLSLEPSKRPTASEALNMLSRF